MGYSPAERLMLALFAVSLVCLFGGFVSFLYMGNSFLTRIVRSLEFRASQCTTHAVTYFPNTSCPCNMHRRRVHGCPTQLMPCYQVEVRYHRDQGEVEVTQQGFLLDSLQTLRRAGYDQFKDRPKCFYDECKDTTDQTYKHIESQYASLEERTRVQPFTCFHNPDDVTQVMPPGSYGELRTFVVVMSASSGAFLFGAIASVLIYKQGFTPKPRLFSLYAS